MQHCHLKELTNKMSLNYNQLNGNMPLSSNTDMKYTSKESNTQLNELFVLLFSVKRIRRKIFKFYFKLVTREKKLKHKTEKGNIYAMFKVNIVG